MPTTGTNSAPARPAMQRGDDVGDELDVGRVVAEEADPLLAVAHGDQQLAVAAAASAGATTATRTSSTPAAMKYSIRWLTGSSRSKPKNAAKSVRPLVPPVRGLLADQQDRERGGQGLAEDREVGAPDPALEHQPSPSSRGDRPSAAARSPAARTTGVANGSHQRGQSSQLPVQLHEVGHVVAADPRVGELEVHAPSRSRRGRRRRPARGPACRRGPRPGRCRRRRSRSRGTCRAGRAGSRTAPRARRANSTHRARRAKPGPGRAQPCRRSGLSCQAPRPQR